MRFTALPTSLAESGKAGTGIHLTNLDYFKELLRRITLIWKCYLKPV